MDYGNCLILNSESLILLKTYCDPNVAITHGYLFVLRKIHFYVMFLGDNLYIVSHLNLSFCNVLSTYALVMLSLQWMPKQYSFYPNGLMLNLLRVILNCWGRFLLSVSFWERDILKLNLLFTYYLSGHWYGHFCENVVHSCVECDLSWIY